MKLEWVARASKELGQLTKGNPALADLAFKESERFAAEGMRFPQRKTINFKMLKNHTYAGRLRIHGLRLFMDRVGDIWIVRKVAQRSDTTYG